MKRNTRNYKEKKPLITFGQFVLPLTVIMAVALLFFSVKLFFLDPGEVSRPPEEETEQSPYKIDKPAAPASGEKPAEVQPQPQSQPQTAVKKTVKVKKEESKPAPAAAVKKETVRKADVRQEPARKSEVKAEPKAEPKKESKTEPKGEGVRKVSTLPAQEPSRSAKPAASADQKPARKSEAVSADRRTERKTAVSADQPAAGGRWDVQIGGFTAKDGAMQVLGKARGEGYDVYIYESKRDGAPFYKVRARGPKSQEDARKLADKLAGGGYPVYLVQIRK